MRFKCIITYRTSRSNGLSIWKTQGSGQDHVSYAAKAIDTLRKKQRRQLTVIGLMIHQSDGG